MTTPSLLKSLLFKSELPLQQGRVIRFDAGTPDIAYTTGSMRERVIQFLQDNQGYHTSSEIAKGIASNSSRTSKTLGSLTQDGIINTIKLEGCVREYGLAQEQRSATK